MKLFIVFYVFFHDSDDALASSQDFDLTASEEPS